MKRHWVTSRWLIVAAILFWAVLVGLSLQRNLAALDEHALTVATERSRVLFQLIETARLWNARHGGVYVPATEETPPNPYLDDNDRDVFVNGRLFTKVNPAYMTRQIAELFRAHGPIEMNLTSLKPIRPQNAPDPWERRALRSFEGGAVEVVERSGSAFRYMAALKTDQQCLRCHGRQGYRIGDVRGGLSMTIPQAVIDAELAPRRQDAVTLHLMAFLILSGVSAALLYGIQRSWKRLEETRASQERMIAERTATLRAEMAERQRMAARLERAVGELEHSNAELEQFAYAVSHDLQEPLRMVNGYAQLLERRHGAVLGGDAREFLGYLVEGATRMNAMITDLLEYSRVNPHRDALPTLDTAELVRQALENLEMAIKESGARIEIGPMPTVQSDGSQLVRLFQNLVGNAIKYREPTRPVEVRIGAEPCPEGWSFFVADNGIGIAPEFHDRIFMVFQRLHSRQDYPGTGVGLAICKKIVERHGGRLWVESIPGQGSVFRFTLPAEAAIGPDLRPRAAPL